MKRLYLISIFISVLLCGHSINNKRLLIDPRATALNDSAVNLSLSLVDKRLDKAIKLLDSAIAIQPDYFTAYWNKIFFQNQLDRSIEALQTLQELEKVKPNNPYFKMMEGAAIEYNGDNETAKTKFTEAEYLYLSILDTFKLKDNLGYKSLILNRAINLKLLGREQEGNTILNNLSDNEKDVQFKESIQIPLSLSRYELILFIWRKN